MATTDSIRSINDDIISRIHSNRPSGRIHKGHSVTAASASIPSKYQTIVIDNGERKGFLSRSKRFTYKANEDDKPGPGSYVKLTEAENASPSYSKKGTGGFASKDRRLRKFDATCGPGSGCYSLPSPFYSRKDFNKAESSSVFHKPIAQQRENLSSNPAPNKYDVLQSKGVWGKNNNVTAAAAFKSGSRRDAINVDRDADSKPAPWHYYVKDDLLRSEVKVPFSSFKSTSERKMQADPPKNPGPGTYKPFEPIEPANRTVFPRKHYLCISAPAMPLPGTPPAPGPGQYDVVDYEGPSKHYMSTAAFVSNTSRWTGHATNEALPGPAHYRPQGVGRQSFIYNASGRWI